jgi:hypothetical protein
MRSFIRFETVTVLAILLMSVAVGVMKETRLHKDAAATPGEAHGLLMPSAATQAPQTESQTQPHS